MSAETEGRLAAERFRHEHKLGEQPLGDLVAIIEQTTGVDVAVLGAGPDEHGLTVFDRVRGAVFIGIARTPHPMRQRSTLAHELGHVLFEDWSDDAENWGARSFVEIRADAFARHLLAPITGLSEFLGDTKTLSELDLSELVQRFLISPAIAAIALHQANYIDDRTKQEWKSITAPKLAARFGWTDQYRALQANSDRQRAPQRLLARTIKGYSEGVVSAQAIATLRGITLQTAENDLQEAGIVQVEHSVEWINSAELPDVDIDLVALDNDLNAPDNIGH